jgi:diacylglycerol kinase
MRIHVLAGFAVSLFGMAIQFDLATRAALILCIALVFFAELLNTAIGALVDSYAGQRHELATVAKNAAAGGVLALTFAALLVFVDILWIFRTTLWANKDTLVFFALFGAPIMVHMSLHLFARPSRLSSFINILPGLFFAPLVYKSNDPIFSVLAAALLLLALSALQE